MKRFPLFLLFTLLTLSTVPALTLIHK
ncbi:hypothetical protein MZH18_09610, partial [Escherichia coli]|nr:hypothetical protein [Escherichia coli]